MVNTVLFLVLIKMSSDLNQLALFVTLVDSGSFTLAAQHLNITKSKLSRHIKALESEMSTQLIIRTTRSQRLTETGRLLYQRCKPHIEALSVAEEDVGSLLSEAKGELKLLFPLEFFNNTISDLVIEFSLKYPKIELICCHYSVNLPENVSDYDLSFILHEGDLPDSNLIARPLLSFPQSLFVAMNYDCKGLSSLSELPLGQCVMASKHESWQFRDGNNVELVKIGRRIVFESPEMRLAAVKQGLGIAKLPNYSCQGDCNLKKLQLDKEPLAQQLSVVFQSRALLFKTRLFLDFLQANIARIN